MTRRNIAPPAAPPIQPGAASRPGTPPVRVGQRNTLRRYAFPSALSQATCCSTPIRSHEPAISRSPSPIQRTHSIESPSARR